MKLIEMDQVSRGLHSQDTEIPPSSAFLSETMVNMDPEPPVWTDQQLLRGVARIKKTGWYRSIKNCGFQAVPAGYREGQIVLLVGTAAALGLAYLGYKRIRERSKTKP